MQKQGEYIQKLRTDFHLSIRYMTKALQLTEEQYNQIEQCQTLKLIKPDQTETATKPCLFESKDDTVFIDRSIAEKMAELFGVSVGEILYGNKKKLTGKQMRFMKLIKNLDQADRDAIAALIHAKQETTQQEIIHMTWEEKD